MSCARHHAKGGCETGVRSPGNGAAEVVPAKLSSRPGFPPAFPPHKCALDQKSVIPVKLQRISKGRCFERGVLLLQSVTEHYRSDTIKRNKRRRKDFKYALLQILLR